MKTIDGKSIEDLRIGQDVYAVNFMGKILAIDSRDSLILYMDDDNIAYWTKVGNISTTKPRKKVLKRFYCLENASDYSVIFCNDENGINSEDYWRRVPEKDFEAEVYDD